MRNRRPAGSNFTPSQRQGRGTHLGGGTQPSLIRAVHVIGVQVGGAIACGGEANNFNFKGKRLAPCTSARSASMCTELIVSEWCILLRDTMYRSAKGAEILELWRSLVPRRAFYWPYRNAEQETYVSQWMRWLWQDADNFEGSQFSAKAELQVPN